jgi:hypothetical protein
MVHLDLLCLQTKKITFININESVSKKKNHQKTNKKSQNSDPFIFASFSLFLFFSTPTKNCPSTLHLQCKKKKKNTPFPFSPPHSTILSILTTISMTKPPLIVVLTLSIINLMLVPLLLYHAT